MAIYLGTDQISLTGTPQTGFMPNSRLLMTKTYSFNLGQTNFSSLTPSTSAQVLTLPATTYTTNPAQTITCFRIGNAYDGTPIDTINHGYLIIGEVVTNYVYTTDMTSTIRPIRFASCRDTQYATYRSSVNTSTGILIDTFSTTSGYITSAMSTLYQNASNNYGMHGNSYGLYGYAQATVTSTGINSYIDLTCNSFNVRANDSYAPAATLSAIKASDMIFNVTWYIYEGDRNLHNELRVRAATLAANS